MTTRKLLMQQVAAGLLLIASLVALSLGWTAYSFAEGAATGWLTNVSAAYPNTTACGASARIAETLLGSSVRVSVLVSYFLLFLVAAALVFMSFPTTVPYCVSRHSRMAGSFVTVVTVVLTVYAAVSIIRLHDGGDVIDSIRACMPGAPSTNSAGTGAIGVLMTFSVSTCLGIIASASWIWATRSAKPPLANSTPTFTLGPTFSQLSPDDDVDEDEEDALVVGEPALDRDITSASDTQTILTN